MQVSEAAYEFSTLRLLTGFSGIGACGSFYPDFQVPASASQRHSLASFPAPSPTASVGGAVVQSSPNPKLTCNLHSGLTQLVPSLSASGPPGTC
jgi:hypothetical protein